MKKPMKKTSKRYNRYQEGGDVEESAAKQRGLDISNKEAPVGFFERIRMGNIDEPGTEAYNRFGAGRGRAGAPVPAPSTSAEEDRPRPVPRIPPQPNPIFAAGIEQGRRQPSGDASVAEDYSGPRTKPIVTAPAKPAASKPKPERDRIAMPQGPMRGMRSDAGKSPPVVTHGFPIYDTGSAASKIPGQSVKAPQGEKIDSSESGRNVGNALMATGALGLGAAGAYKAKKMYDAAKKLKAGMKKRPGKDFLEGLSVSDMTAKKRGGAVKKYASGGMVSSASKRADGIAMKGKTRGKIC